ncbi:MAG TPA: mechanosensitive ion channel family protein [Acidimicrobiales bacterium]
MRGAVPVLAIDLSDRVIVTPAKILLVVVLAAVFGGLARKGVDRFTRKMRGEIVEGGLRGWRRRRTGPSADGSDVVSVPSLATLRAAQRAETIGTLLKSVVSLVVWAFAALMVLSEIGLDVGPLVAGAGFLGIALGFGAQNLVRDFLSGIFMLVEDQYGVGDVIDAGPATGTVEAVSLRTTRLRDIHGVVWHIPNGTIDRIGNKSQGWSRALLDISVAYSTDLDVAQQVIESCAMEMVDDDAWSGEILDAPEVWGVEDLGPDGVVIRVSVKTRPASQWRVARELRARLKLALENAAIEIPFPQRVVWHRGTPQEVAPD